jgi:hypothetical protein
VPTFTANDVVWVLVGDTYHRGRVRYARMAPPNFTAAEAYSVYLDEHDPGYFGTIAPADTVLSDAEYKERNNGC